MDETVLQQGDQIGTTGGTGTGGSTGATGAQGAFTNVLSIELVYSFTPTATPSAVSLATTYVVEAGTTGFWEASGVHSYVNSSFIALITPGTTTISNFLQDTAKKYSIHLQLKRTDLLATGGLTELLPNNIATPITAEVYDTSDDNIIIRFVTKPGAPISFNRIANMFNVRKLTFSLLIIGTDA